MPVCLLYIASHGHVTHCLLDRTTGWPLSVYALFSLTYGVGTHEMGYQPTQ
jgi:hypothetical protein